MLQLRDLTDRALTEIDGAAALHLVPGRPPMVRTADRELRPLSDDLAVLGFQDIMLMLQVLVEPERWDSLEQVGEGEITLPGDNTGRQLTITLYRSSETWQAVVHL